MEVHEWFQDGHKIQVVLEGESTHLKVLCPGLEAGHRIEGLRCGMGTDEHALHEVENFCFVTEMVAELGMEAHCSGLGIIVTGDVPIQWGWYSEDEFWFKCAGYPSYEEAKKFKDEAIEELFADSVNSIPNMRVPMDMLPLLPLRPWAEVDEETKEGLKETLRLHIENEERRRKENGSRTKA